MPTSSERLGRDAFFFWRVVVGCWNWTGLLRGGRRRGGLVFEDDVQGVDDAGDVLLEGAGLAHSLGERGRSACFRILGWTAFSLGVSSSETALTPRMVRRMLISRSAPHPRSRKTPSGGRMMAKMILQMSLEGG